MSASSCFGNEKHNDSPIPFLLPCAPFPARYQAVYQVFVFISRSSVNIAPIRTLWMLQLPAVFQVANFVFLLLVAVYDFVPSIWIVFAIVCWEGLMG